MQAVSLAANGLPCVIVSRPGKWGNPFKVVHRPNDRSIAGDYWVSRSDTRAPVGTALFGDYWVANFVTRDAALACCINMYRDYILGEIRAGRLDIGELGNKNLSCFCPMGSPCHADVLLGLSNLSGHNV